MIGIDLIKSVRMKGLVERFGEKALLRFLSQSEIELVKNYKTAAGFWAVKEAVSKALGVGIGSECAFHDISISKTKKGAPQVSLTPELLQKYSITDISISITHDGEYAVAVAAIETIKT